MGLALNMLNLWNTKPVEQGGAIGKVGAVSPRAQYQNPEEVSGGVSLESKVGTSNQYQPLYGQENYVAKKLDLLG